ncbi:hypothetical protein TARUN_678 [Trichoderma arundinaceum]|uniref:Tat pathway signal sequence n=1 Tax=Trichoderma arundinaceum TaxID=490622 RepID=A0A395NZN8_TRIAR|nr:hypothetical protein TARUN_678 [Trichoderma arundinaceum]
MPSYTSSAAYAALSKQDEDDASSTETLTTMSTRRTQGSRLVWCSIILIAINSTLLLIIVVAVLAVYSTQQSPQQSWLLGKLDTSSLLKQTSGYSPVFDRYAFSLQPVFQDNPLFSDKVLRQRPNNATDEAWSELSKLSSFTISADEVRKLGQDPIRVTHMPGDPSSFPVMLSVTHQLHCLNHIRMGLEGAHYLHGKERSRHDWEHIYHCLDFLTQITTCHADVDLILWHWYENMEQPQPNFSGDMKCRDFDGLKSWVDGIGFPTEDIWYFKREGRVYDMPVDPAYLKYLREHPEDASSH